MSDNIIYKISENFEYKNEKIDIACNNFINYNDYNKFEDFPNNDSLHEYDSSVLATELEIMYSQYYTVRMLYHIINYYELQTKKGLKKDELIQLIILFETDPSNKEVFLKRIRMWNYINELKNDKYFKKYISF